MEATQTTTLSSTGKTRRKVKIRPPKLFGLQERIALSLARFLVVVCGRRWGKTRLGAWKALKGACQRQRIWWVAPVIATARILWRILKPLIKKIPGAKIRESEKVFFFPGGGELWIKSADQPDNLRGEGLDGVIVDEADYISGDVWVKILRPMLADRKGWALFISTPREQNGYFHELFKKGEKDGVVWASWNFPSWTNPFLDPKEIEDAKRDMSEMEFDQEFGAKFVGSPDNVYFLFSNELHVKPCRFNPFLPVWVGVDFNYKPRVAVFLQRDPVSGYFKAVGEVYEPRQMTTDDHAELVARWLEERGVRRYDKKFDAEKVKLCPDATGKTPQRTGKSDHKAFEDAGFTLDVALTNPLRKDRDNLVLAWLKNKNEEVRTQIDPSCKHLIDCFGKLKHKTRDSSGKDWGHILDGFGYALWRAVKPGNAVSLPDNAYEDLYATRY